MTIVGLGRITPSQLYILQLSGLVIQGRELVSEPTEEQIEESKSQGLKNLIRLTGEDFGLDIMAWFDYLKKSDFEVTHPYGYGQLKSRLKSLGYEC